MPLSFYHIPCSTKTHRSIGYWNTQRSQEAWLRSPNARWWFNCQRWRQKLRPWNFTSCSERVSRSDQPALLLWRQAWEDQFTSTRRCTLSFSTPHLSLDRSHSRSFWSSLRSSFRPCLLYQLIQLLIRSRGWSFSSSWRYSSRASWLHCSKRFGLVTCGKSGNHKPPSANSAVLFFLMGLEPNVVGHSILVAELYKLERKTCLGLVLVHFLFCALNRRKNYLLVQWFDRQECSGPRVHSESVREGCNLWFHNKFILAHLPFIRNSAFWVMGSMVMESETWSFHVISFV